MPEERVPDAAITRGTNPLMAGKFAFHHEVDILLADVDMKRMDGIQLIHFVRQKQPVVRAYLMGQESTLRDLPLNMPEDMAGLIVLPFTPVSVRGNSMYFRFFFLFICYNGIETFYDSPLIFHITTSYYHLKCNKSATQRKERGNHS